MKKLIIGIGIATAAVLLGFGLTREGKVNLLGTFSGSGVTNTTSTVNTTSTRILPGTWTEYARITNRLSTDVSCYADNLTAASSSVAIDGGFVIGRVTTTTISNPSYIEFGTCANCIPFVGAVNCISDGAVGRVGVFYR